MLTLLTLSLSVEARGLILRGTHKVCGNDAELTLYSSGRMVFWDESRSYQGTYSIQDGYLLLLDENGRQIFACKYKYDSQSGKLLWVNVGGVMMRKC